jgi:hypothetical protein
MRDGRTALLGRLATPETQSAASPFFFGSWSPSPGVMCTTETWQDSTVVRLARLSSFLVLGAMVGCVQLTGLVGYDFPEGADGSVDATGNDGTGNGPDATGDGGESKHPDARTDAADAETQATTDAADAPATTGADAADARPSPFLAGSVSITSAAVTLSDVGGTDWAHWGAASGPVFVDKSGGGGLITDSTEISGTSTVFTNSPRPMSWTGGTPTASSSNDTTGIYVNGIGNGFTFSAPADTTTRVLLVYCGAWGANASFVADLSDGSAASYSDSSVNAPQDTPTTATYTLTYSAASAGQQIHVKWVVVTNNNPPNKTPGNVTLEGAAMP